MKYIIFQFYLLVENLLLQTFENVWNNNLEA